MSVSTIGNIDVKVNVAEIKTAVSELNNLAKVAGATQSALDKLAGIKLDNIRVSVTGARGDIAGLSGAVQLATNRLQQMAATNLGALSSQAQSLTNALNQAAKAGQSVGQGLATGAGSGAAALGNLGGAAGNAFNSVNGLSSLLTNGLKFTGVATILTGLYQIDKSAYDSYQTVQSLTMGLRAMGQDGAAGVNALRAAANNLGVDFDSITKASLQWQAATAGTRIEGEKANQIFSTMSGTIKLFGGSTDEVNGALKALTQMMSKGTVQSEELKGQLGERLPGAFRLMAESLGMSTAELTTALKNGMVEAEFAISKLTDTLQNKYGGGIKDAAKTTNSELNRMKNDWGVFAAGVGKDIDGMVGDFARLTNASGILKSLGGGAIYDAAVESNRASSKNNKLTPEQQAQMTVDEYNRSIGRRGSNGGFNLPRIERKKQEFEGPIVGLTRGPKTVITETYEQALARTIKENRDNDKFNSALKPTLDYNSNLLDSAKQAEDAAKSKVYRDRERADNRAELEATIEAAKSNDETVKIRRKIIKLKGQIKLMKEKPTMSPEANADAILGKEAELAVAESDLARKNTSIGKRGAAADKREQNAADRALNERDTLVNRSTTYSAQLNEQRLRLSDGEGMAGEIARTNRQYDELINRLEKVQNLSESELKTGKEKIEAERKAALENIESIKKIKDEQEAAKEVEQQRLQIQRDLNSETKSGNTFFRHFDATLALAGNGVSKYISDFQDGYSIKSKYSKDKDAFVNSGLAKNDEAKASINQKIEEQKWKILDAEEALSQMADKTNKTYKEREKLVEKMRDNLTGLNDRRKLLESSRENQKNQLGDAFNTGYNDKRMVSYGVTSGAQDYMDGIKGKAERASEQVNKFGSALTSVFMAKSWGDAKNTMKGFFAGLLTSIQEAIVQLLIVKPIIDSIQTSFKAASGGERSGGIMGLFSSLITNAITGGVGSMGNAGFGDYSAAGMAAAFKPQALGGAWMGGVQMFANGGIVNRATPFGMAGGGMGVAGEAGPEGILPLRRNSKGQLGVMAGDGGGNQISNNLSINIAGNADSSTIDQIKSELLPIMNELAKNQANNAVGKAQRPGGSLYR